MYFTHITLKNWRNFTNVDVDLQRRVFLVGPNASGKSNFLDALRFLRDIVAVGGGLEEAVRKRHGIPALRCFAARKQSDVEMEVKIIDEINDSWTYKLQIKGQEKDKYRPEIVKEQVKKNEQIAINRPDKNDREDPVLLTQTHLEQNQANRKFRELADFFRKIEYMHLVPQLIRTPDRYLIVDNDPFGSDFLVQIGKAKTNTRNARLKRINQALRSVVPQLTSIEFLTDSKGRNHIRGKYEHWRYSGAWQSEDQFSDGTLRLIGLLWSLQVTQSPVLLEEPELSLHPGIIKYIPQMIARVQAKKRRQIFLSTHSSEILTDKGIGLDEVLTLIPDIEGTKIQPASSIDQIKVLLDSGLTLADIIMPETTPKNAEQLTLFGG